MTETRDQRRSKRHRPVRARTLSAKRGGLRHLMVLAADIEPIDYDRPSTRSDCKSGARPCPWVSCRWHLYLDVSPQTGALKLNFPDIGPERMLESCALDIADLGGRALEDVGAIMNLTRERVRQIEGEAMTKVAPLLGATFPEQFGGEAGPNRSLAVLTADTEHQPQFGQEDTAA